MWFKLKIWLKNPSENLWLTPALGALFATFFSLFATASRYFIPANAVPNISIETLSSLLDIIASSMLAVTTFSLSIMVAAFASASSSGTPRAYKLMMSDDNTRLAITSFISAFIYAVIAKIALGLEYYGPAGRFILFVSTILVLMYLIYTLIRWVHTLSKLGTLGTTIGKIEVAAGDALATYRTQTNYGASGTPPDTQPQFQIFSAKTGYLANFDIEGLNLIAEKHQLHLHLNEVPGKFLDPKTPLISVYSQQNLDAEQQQQIDQLISDSLIIESDRSFLQDPRFGLLVMSEVAQKAMSSAINDVGSAISGINALTRILIDRHSHPDQPILDYPNISMHGFDMKELITSSFAPLARDCMNNIELNQRMLKALAMIKNNVPEVELQQAAEETAVQLLERSLKHFEFAPDQALLIEAFEKKFPNVRAS